MAAAPLITRGRVKQISNGMALQVQAEKIVQSKLKIAEARQEGIFPKDDKAIISYVTSRNARNRSLNLDSFYTRMAKAPKLWNKKFIHDAFSGDSIDLLMRIAEATSYAWQLMDSQYRQFPTYKKSKRTNHLYDSQRITIDGQVTNTAQRRILSYSGEGSPVVELTNFAEYASTSEVNAIHYRKIGGIIFWVAKRVQTRYSDLGIRFEYAKAAEYSLPHKYDVPVLRITSADQITERGRWSRPGSRRRARERFASRVRRSTNAYNRRTGGAT